MKPLFFTSPAQFRAWLRKNHQRSTEVLVGFWKVGTGKPTLTWSESVDEALCFGWIDGKRTSLDARRYAIRFTPRKASSNWSAINVGKVKALVRAARMKPAGLRAFEARPEKTSGYSFEQKREATFSSAQRAAIAANARARAWFDAKPPGYRRNATFWVVSAKREETRASRLATLIACSARGQEIPPLARRPPRP